MKIASNQKSKLNIKLVNLRISLLDSTRSCLSEILSLRRIRKPLLNTRILTRMASYKSKNTGTKIYHMIYSLHICHN